MKKDRLYGIDVARIFAMFLVLLFHAQGVLSGFGGSGFAGKVLNAASIACIAISVAMYLVISFLEFLRMKLFALCRVGEALKRIFAER